MFPLWKRLTWLVPPETRILRITSEVSPAEKIFSQRFGLNTFPLCNGRHSSDSLPHESYVTLIIQCNWQWNLICRVTASHRASRKESNRQCKTWVGPGTNRFSVLRSKWPGLRGQRRTRCSACNEFGCNDRYDITSRFLWTNIFDSSVEKIGIPLHLFTCVRTSP